MFIQVCNFIQFIKKFCIDLKILTAIKFYYRYGVKEINRNQEKIIVRLSYTPKTETITSKYGTMPVSFLSLGLTSEEDFKLIELAAQRFSFANGLNSVLNEMVPAITSDQEYEVYPSTSANGASSMLPQLTEEETGEKIHFTPTSTGEKKQRMKRQVTKKVEAPLPLVKRKRNLVDEFYSTISDISNEVYVE